MSRARLDSELVRRKIVGSRSAARRAIKEGQVQVKGIVSPKPATMIDRDTPVELLADAALYVGRGGDKLAHALSVFGIEVSGARAIDLGASTGGFTDCLLQAGVEHVVAVDVGYGQLDFRLREDDRVTVLERTNVRFLDLSTLQAPFDLVVGDLSFISLELVIEVVAGLVGDKGQSVLLIKPQFEVGKSQVSRGGVVTDPKLWRQAIERIISASAAVGLGAVGLTVSPLRGAAAGNREFLLLLRPGDDRLASADIEQSIQEAQKLGEEAKESQ